jgi:hypothetical protein
MRPFRAIPHQLITKKLDAALPGCVGDVGIHAQPVDPRCDMAPMPFLRRP